MIATRWAFVSIMAGLSLLGCHRQPQQGTLPTPQPAPSGPEARQRLQQVSPEGIIGRVVVLLPSERLAAVADVPVAKVRQGDTITFWGEGTTFLTGGRVIRIAGDTIHVQYQPPQEGSREPAVGDLALFKPVGDRP